jgi:D-alanyl-D-alanine carboxypeptidase
MSRRTLLALLAVVVLVLATPTAQAGPASPVAKLQRELDGLLQDGIPGAILLVRDGSRTIRLASGAARLSPREPMRANDRFRVGSITKSFVSSAVVQLVGEGKVSLGDTVERWLPGLVPNGAGITIRRLLNHTSGLYDYTHDPRLLAPFLAGDLGHVWAPRDLVGLAATHPPLFAPGERWSYSNTNFILLGLVVEAATGHTLEQELRERIFTPLGLADTSFGAGSRIAGRHSHGYSSLRPGRTGPLRDVTQIDQSWAWAAGAIVSTAGDLADFYRGLMRGDLVTRHLVWRMESTVAIDAATGYGLGLLQVRLPCSYAWGHDGRVPGYLSLALSSGSGARQVVLSLNTDAPHASAGDHVGRLVVDAYCGRAARG